MKLIWRQFLCILTAAPLWAAGWGVLESDRARVYTNAPEAEARRALAGLDEVARGMDALWGPLPASAPPLRVYLFRDLPGLRAMGARGFSRGFFQSGPDYDVIAAVAGEADSVRAVRHEYIHRVLHRSSRRIPQWLEEGLAELYSTLAWEGGRWVAGRPVEGHLHTLRQRSWMTFAELERMHEDESMWLRSDGVMRFYGQSWALAHHLAVDSERAERFPALLRRLMDGEPAAAAIEAEYGEKPDALLRAAQARVEEGVLRVLRVERPASAPAPAPAPAARWSAVPEGEADVALAELAAAVGHRAEDSQWEDRLRRAARNSPRARTRLGVLALRQGDKAGAEAHFRAAVAAGVKEPAAAFELAMLIRDRQGATPEVLDLLHRTIALNPAHGEALYILAVEAQRAGRPGEATTLLERAASALPRQFLFREALARNYAAAGRAADARAQALAARSAARTRDEIAMAEGLLRELDQAEARPAAEAEPRKPEVTVPRGWLEPKHDGVVRGVLARVHCGNPVVFELETATGERRFKANPARLMVSGRAQDAPFRCGEQPEKFPVEARFQTPDRLVQLVFLPPAQ
jgi:hypothetical protein